MAVAQVGRKAGKKNIEGDVGFANLGLTINMDGQTYNVAQKSEPGTVERDVEKIRRGREILKKERANDPDGNLGMTINMGGESISVAQTGRKDSWAENYLRTKVQNNRDAYADPNGDLGMKMNVEGDDFSVAQTGHADYTDRIREGKEVREDKETLKK